MGTFVVLTYLILNATVAPAFSAMELAAAETNLVRARRAIRNDLDNLSAIVGDWAPWDDAFYFARGENPGFTRSNLNRPTLENLELDALLVYDSEGRRLWGELLLDGALVDPEPLGVFNADNLQSDLLIRHESLDGATEGLLQTDLGTMMLSSRPILTSDNKGPIAGTMIMGHFFDAARMTTLQERTEVELAWHALDEETPVDADLKREVVASGADGIRHAVSEASIETYTVLNDLFGEPLLILRVSTPRSITALGGRTVKGALLFLSVAGIVVAAVTWLLLRRVIVLPLTRLAGHIAGIRESGDLSLRLNERRKDEIGALATEFDHMTTELYAARQLLLDQSFKAGKADTAAEVLHNIRNAMTPLINGIDRLSKQFRFSGNLRVQQATTELADAGCPPERREKLLKYVESAFGHVQEASDAAVGDLQVAAKQARQVEAILMDQERFANVSPVVESLDLGDVIEEATLVIPERDQPGVRLNLQPGLKGVKVRAHRVGLLQVMGNLILNAYEAIQRHEAGSGSIEVAANTEVVDSHSMIRVTVRDSGCGFDPVQQQQIFQRGYSSKKGHMSGLGLHWCANSLAGMGGRIVAESAGAGRGAQFHVLLPAA
jgi:sensor domain CHASE-containing protein